MSKSDELLVCYQSGIRDGINICAAGPWRTDVENAPENKDFLVALNSGDCGYIAYREEGYHGVFVVWCYGEKSYVPQSHILAFAELRPYQNTEQEDE